MASGDGASGSRSCVPLGAIVGAFGPQALRRVSANRSDRIIFNAATDDLFFAGREVALAPRFRRLAFALASRNGGLLTVNDLVDIMWGDDPDGGPEDTRLSVSVLISQCRKVLAPLGIFIRTEWGRGFYAECASAPLLQPAE